MRKTTTFMVLSALAAALSSCGTPSTWDKAGADNELMNADFVECRRTARQDAYRQLASISAFGLTGPSSSAYRSGYASRYDSAQYRQRLADDRSYAEQRLTNGCMRAKGYERAAS